MHMRWGIGSNLWFTGLPIPHLNLVRLGQTPDLDEVEVFAKELSTSDVPWSISFRGDADPALLDLAAHYGRTSPFTYAMLMWDAELVLSLPTSAPPGARVREIAGRDHAQYAAALVHGSDMPKAVADVFARPDLLDAPEMTAFVLDIDGETVASGFNTVVGDQAGMFNGAVPLVYRRNGYFRTLVAVRLRHAVASGARHVISLNTPMSRPLYESLGFRLAETWTYLTAE